MSGLLRTIAVSALVVCAASQKSAGCGRNLPDGQQNGGQYNATVGGRRFLVNVPDDYNKATPSPLILAFHGGGGSPENHITVDQLTLQVKSDYPDLSMDIDDIFYVYPAGSSKAGCEQKNTCDKLYWSVDPDITADDIGFVNSVLDSLEDTYCLDMNRLYAEGKSQGGGLVNKLACDSGVSKRVAAFSPVSGAYYTAVDDCEPPFEFDLNPFCSPGRDNVPIFAFHGKKDTTIPFDGASRRKRCLPRIPHWADQWAARDRLSASPEKSELTPTTSVFKYGGGLVTLIVDDNLGHVWPATVENGDNDGKVGPFDFTPLMLRFFDKKTLS